MHRKSVSVLKRWNVCYFKHAHVQTHGLYLGNISAAAKSISEKLGSVGIKAAPLTLICLLLKDGGRAQSTHPSPPHHVLLPLLSASPLIRGSCWRSFNLPRCILWLRWRMSLCSFPVQPCQGVCSPALILEQLSSWGESLPNWVVGALQLSSAWYDPLGALLTWILSHRINFLAWPWTYLITTDMVGDPNPKAEPGYQSLQGLPYSGTMAVHPCLHLLICYPAQLPAPPSLPSHAPSLHVSSGYFISFPPVLPLPQSPSPSMCRMVRVAYRPSFSAWFSLVTLQIAECCIYSPLLQFCKGSSRPLGLFILISQVFLMYVSFSRW